MTHLVIITPKAGDLDYLLTYSSDFKKTISTANYAYFTYVGEESAHGRVCKIISSFSFKEFSLDKEKNYYRLKIYVE